MKAVALVVSLLGLSIGGPVRAASLAGVDLPDTETVNGIRLVLNGMGLREATFLRVKAYVGGLYLEKPSSDPDTTINSRQCKRVTMVFLRDIDGARLASGWADELRKVDGTTTEPSIPRFTSLIGDVKKGDTMSFTWCPDAGVEVASRGTVRPSGWGWAKHGRTSAFGRYVSLRAKRPFMSPSCPYLRCFVENEASRRVIERVGFRYVGRLEDDVWRDGRWWSHLRFELTAQEWRDVQTGRGVGRPRHA